MDTSDWFSLRGRTALVTGGSSGIGRVIAEGFIAAGARVYISSRHGSNCARAASELGDLCTALPQDLSTMAGCEALAEQFTAREARLDILVNNAGTAWGEEFTSFPETGWDRVLDLNAKAPFFLTQKLYQPLKTAGGPIRPAKVINIASIDGIRTNAWQTYSYHAAKAALIHLTRRMAARLVVDHINVTAIAPGAFASRMNRAARDRGEAVAKTIPSQRIGNDCDIASAALYLAARSGDYVVGETIVVDGGLTHASIDTDLDPSKL